MLAPGEAFFAEPGDTVSLLRACSAGGTSGPGDSESHGFLCRPLRGLAFFLADPRLGKLRLAWG